MTHQYLESLAATPLVEIRLSAAEPAIWCKLEFLNPSGSTKDRIARYIIAKALRERRLAPGGMVIEASSGSTSIAMAMVCAQMGLGFTAVLPKGVSSERVLMMRAYGGLIHFAPAGAGMGACIVEAERLAAETGAFLPRQFSNPENAEAHRFGTAREILEQIPGGRVETVVSGVGTGGSLVGLLTGCDARRGILARPVEISEEHDQECCSFSCRIPGVVECASTIFTAAAWPAVETIEVRGAEAIETTRELIRLGFPVGPSSGLNYRAAMLAGAGAGPAVTVFPDRMERYFSTELFRPFTN